MEEEVSSKQIGIKYGLILGLTGTVIFLVPSLLRSTFPGTLVVHWVAFILFFTLGMKEYKKGNGGQMSFGEGFGLGMTITLIGGLIRAIMHYVHIMVDPDFMDFMKEAQENSPFGPPSDSGQDMSAFIDFFADPIVISGMSFLGAILAGLIFGSIVAAIVKNDEDEF